MIELVFWLALISNGYQNSGSVTISPVPFSTQEGCEEAADLFIGDAGTRVSAVCYPQRLDDVAVFQSWAGYVRAKEYAR